MNMDDSFRLSAFARKRGQRITGAVCGLSANENGGILVVDADGCITYTNVIADGFFRAEPGTLLGCRFSDITLDNGNGEIDVFMPNGLISTADMHCSPIEWTGKSAYIVSIQTRHHGIMPGVPTGQSNALLQAMVSGSPMAIIATDEDGSVTLWNSAATSILGWSESEVLGHALPLTSDATDHSLRGVWEAAMLGEEVSGFELPSQRRRDGQPLALQVWGAEINGGQGVPKGMMLMLADITARRRVEAHIRHLIGHDVLTSLPNRRQFSKQLHRTLNKIGQHHHRPLMVLQLGIDRFKTINKAIGHKSGDHLLQAVARRLTAALYETDLVARTGGDEFSILLRDTHHLHDGARVADKLLREIADTPFHLDGQELYITGSIGIAVRPHDGSKAKELIHAADNAMDRAKHLGGNNSQFNTQDLDIDARQQLCLEHGLRHALEHDELFLEFQPQFDLDSGAMVGVEALLRWQHPVLGRVSPVDFIPVAESSGLILPIGAWVLNTACMQLKAWDDEGLPPLRMAVNVSPRQFQSGKLKSEVRQALHVSGIASGRLELELTESILVRNAPDAIETMQNLRTLGVRISIDDFGTGYSGLSYLVDLPVDTLKIDQSFVRRLDERPGNRAIISAIGKLAHGLGLSVIAEGVEQSTQLDFLRQISCDEVQGYLLARPLPPNEVASLLVSQPALRTSPATKRHFGELLGEPGPATLNRERVRDSV